MAHEHIGDCCGQHEHHAAEHIHQVALNAGSLCCSGHCHHPEHQAAQAMLEQQRSQELLNTQLETLEKPIEKAKAKSRKKKTVFLFGKLLTQAA